jgi:hypothetical protein
MKPKPLKGFEVLLIIISIQASIILFANLLSLSNTTGEVRTYGNYNTWVYEGEVYATDEMIEEIEYLNDSLQ